jgi:HAD superfamily hydrolase (TIGR01549 family)
MYDGVIFDQDGILLDSGINKFYWMDEIRAEQARKKGFDFSVDDAIKIVKANSPEPVERLLQKKGMTWEHLKEMELAVENRKIHKIEHGEITLFPEVKNVLNSLDKKKAVVTNAPLLSTRMMMRYFGISQEFGVVNAPHTDDMRKFFSRKKPKPVMIKETMDKMNLENPLMVGDTGSDLKAAENAGIDSVHINSYGFETDVEPTYVADSIKEVLEIVE